MSLQKMEYNNMERSDNNNDKSSSSSSSSPSTLSWVIMGGVAVAATTGIIYFLYKNGNMRTPSQAANESISKIFARLKSQNDDEAAQQSKEKIKIKAAFNQQNNNNNNNNNNGKTKNNNVNNATTPKKVPINLANTPGRAPISPISNVQEVDISNLTLERGERTPIDNVLKDSETTSNDKTAQFLTPYKLPDIQNDELITMLYEMIDELENAKVKADDESTEDNIFFFYGSFMGSIMTMQTVYQEFGFAEYPDVLTVIKNKKDIDDEINKAWLKLKGKLDEVNFNHIPFFKGNLTRDEVVFVLDELLRAGKTVLLKIEEISNSEDISRTIELAETFLLKNPSRQNYLKFQSAVDDPIDFEFINDAILEWKDMDTIAIIEDNDIVFEEFQNQYNLKFMVEVMKPLTEVQNHLMRNYGMGGTNLSQEVAKWQKDPEIKILKQELNGVMNKLNGGGNSGE